MNFCSVEGDFARNRAVSAASIVASVIAVPGVPTVPFIVNPPYSESRSLSILCAIAAIAGPM
jgi:hypothetical protein